MSAPPTLPDHAPDGDAGARPGAHALGEPAALPEGAPPSGWLLPLLALLMVLVLIGIGVALTRGGGDGAVVGVLLLGPASLQRWTPHR